MRLRHRVTFERSGSVRDAYGNMTQGWSELGKVYANVRETTGKERLANGAIENQRTATIRVRASEFSRGITEADRVVARSETWNIRGIANVDDKEAMLDILVEAGVQTDAA